MVEVTLEFLQCMVKCEQIDVLIVQFQSIVDQLFLSFTSSISVTLVLHHLLAGRVL